MRNLRLPRLLFALLGAAVLMTALTTSVSFVIYGSWETTERAVMDNTLNAAMVAISAFLVFNFTLGLASMILLARRGRTGAGAHALAGAAAGLIFGIASAALFGTPIEPVVLLVLMGIFAVMLLLARALAGLRRRPE